MQAKALSKFYLMSLAVFFLGAIHYFQPNLGGFGLYIPFNNTAWISVSIILLVAFWQLAHSGKFFYCKSDITLALVIIVCTFPLFWSSMPWRGLSYDRYLGMAALLLIVVSVRQFTFTQNQKYLLWALFSAAALIQGLIGLTQFLNPDYFSFIRHARPVGSLLQANVYASLMATGLAVSFYQLLSADLNRYLRWLHYSLVFTAGLIQVLVLSRTGMIGAIVVVLGMSLLFKSHRGKLIKIWMVLLFGILIAVFLKSYNLSEPVREGLSSPGYRSIMYGISLDLIKEAPLLGHGLGSFSSVYMMKQAELLLENPGLIEFSSPITHPHNELLFWWIEAGMLPVLAFILFSFWFSVKVWARGDASHKAAWICLIPIVLHTQTELPFYHSAPHLIIFALLLSLSTPDKFKTLNHSLQFVYKFIGVIIFTLTSIFMATNLHTIWLLDSYGSTKDEKLLQGIINPFAQQEVILIHRVESLIGENTPDTLGKAEYIARRISILHPSEGAYWLLSKAQYKSGNVSEALQTRGRARLLFPSSKLFR